MSPTVTPPVEKQHRGLHLPLASGGWAGRRGLASLRVRIWPKCPERYLSELIWASKPDCGITTTRNASSNLRHHQARSQNKGLNRISQLQTIPLL